MGNADGHSKKTLSSGDLIHASDGTPLIVLGIPTPDSTVGHLLDGAIVVLAPGNIPSLHLPLIPVPGKPPILVPWDLGWCPIQDHDIEPDDPPPSRRREALRSATMRTQITNQPSGSR